ncbi:hypothetical protein WJX73_006670 [Symbiochloris irregularis]|uniref:EamA domain-containing protein n=1 Tax=Symbiochloris irregularis TaxID=706552 RepID=A0AAW1PUS8_9CHLO
MDKEEDSSHSNQAASEPLLSGLRDEEAQTSGSTRKLQPSASGRGEEQDRSALGLALYALSSCFLSTALVFAKKLGQWHMPTFEILMARSITLMFFALIGCAWKRVHPLGNRRWLLLVRGIFGFGAIVNYLFAVMYLPLHEALVLTFTAPVWASILGPFLIKETPQKMVAVSIAMCMVGTILITQPSVLGFAKNERSLLGVGFALLQAFSSACAKMCVRELRTTESPFVSVLYLSMCSFVASIVGCAIPAALKVPNSFRLPIGLKEWGFLLGVGLASWGSQICMTNALRFARAAPALAMSYLSVVITLIYGYFVFNEIPTKWSGAGSALILSSTLAMGVFERKKDQISAVQAERSQQPNSDLYRWLLTKGARTPQQGPLKLAISDLKNSAGRGLIVTQDCAAGEVLLTVPCSLALMQPSSDDGDWSGGLALQILQLKAEGLRDADGSEGMGTWGNALPEMPEHFAAVGVHQQVSDAALTHEALFLKDVVSQAAQAYADEIQGLGLTPQDFVWAFSMGRSRSFALEWGQELVHVMVPGIDMANHSFTPTAQVGCRFNPDMSQGQDAVEDVCDPSTFLPSAESSYFGLMVGDEPLSAGAEITISYGSYPNEVPQTGNE